MSERDERKIIESRSDEMTIFLATITIVLATIAILLATRKRRDR